MSFLAPPFLGIAAAAIAALVGLHFITRHRSPRTPLPTTRFVPESAARITARSLRLSDRWLLALRALAIGLAGLALAGPVLMPTRQALARVVVLDASRAVADANAARDSALAYLRDADALVVFDSAARIVNGDVRDTLASFAVVSARGSLSAALVAALRAAHGLRNSADSLELVVVSPLADEQFDAATSGLRGLWPGRGRVIRTAPATNDEPNWPPRIRGRDQDPLRAAVALARAHGATLHSGSGRLPRASSRYDVLIVRGEATAEDSAWASAGGHVLVHWPEDMSMLSTRGSTDTTGAVIAGSAVVLSAFERAAVPSAGERVAARWPDGEAAAAERRVGAGCLREVAVPVPSAGDLVLRPGFAAFVREMTAPCGSHTELEPASDSLVQMLAGEGSLLPAAGMRDTERRSPLAPWFLALALATLVAEQWVRRRGTA